MFKIKRRSDNKHLAAKCITLKKIEYDNGFLRPYIESEISILSSLDSRFIMKLEDSCFISSATRFVREDHLVIISEVAERNLS